MAGHCTQLIVERRHGRRPTATHLWFPQGTTNPRSYHRHPFNAHIALARPTVSHKNLVVVGGVSTRRTTTIPTHAHTHTQDCPYSPIHSLFSPWRTKVLTTSKITPSRTPMPAPPPPFLWKLAKSRREGKLSKRRG